MNIGISIIAGNTADTLDLFFSWATKHFDEINVVCQLKNYDSTSEICRCWSDHFKSINLIFHEFDDFSSQFNRAIQMCTKDWCILLGADEILVDFPYDHIPTLMDRMKKDVGILPRFNLQRDYKHYNREGYPDFQKRLIRMESGIGMNGAIVDETLNADSSQCTILEPLQIIHFGHIRPINALIQKGKDRIRFADADNCDGPKLKEHGIEWFIKRNEKWDREAQSMMTQHVQWIKKYLPENSKLRG